jgi:hypothetical protein
MMAYYDHRVFGDVFTLPYRVNRATYAVAPYFPWQRPRPQPVYRHEVMRDFYSKWELGDYLYARTPAGFLSGEVKKAGTLLFFFLGLALLPPIVMLPWVLRDRRVRFLVIAGAVFGTGLSLNVWLFPHYIAPFTSALYAILLQAMRHLRLWRSGGRPSGLAVVRVMPVVCLILAVFRLYSAPLNINIPRWPTMWYGTEPLGLSRAHILAELETYAGPQLAIVRYGHNHAPFDDWVYNKADIDKSRVVWARESDTGNNPDLLRYFRDRRVWLVEPDSDPPKLSPYPIRQQNPPRM